MHEVRNQLQCPSRKEEEAESEIQLQHSSKVHPGLETSCNIYLMGSYRSQATNSRGLRSTQETETETRIPTATLKQQLKALKWAVARGVGGGPRCGWSGPLKTICAFRALRCSWLAMQAGLQQSTGWWETRRTVDLTDTRCLAPNLTPTYPYLVGIHTCLW